MLSSVDHFLLIQGSNRTRNHSELQAAYLQQLLLCTAVVWKTTHTIYSIKLFLTDLLTETRVCLVAYKQKHFCISDQKAVQWLFTVVLNLTSCYQGNHGCHKIILESEILKITTLIQTNWWLVIIYTISQQLYQNPFCLGSSWLVKYSKYWFKNVVQWSVSRQKA